MQHDVDPLEANFKALACAVVRRAILDAQGAAIKGKRCAGEARNWLLFSSVADALIAGADLDKDQVTRWVLNLTN